VDADEYLVVRDRGRLYLFDLHYPGWSELSDEDRFHDRLRFAIIKLLRIFYYPADIFQSVSIVFC
jgi:hypothetical protein